MAHTPSFYYPAVLRAFQFHSDRVLPLFISHGAQLDGFVSSPVSLLNASYFSKQVKILRSVGFSDWNPGGCPNEFLKEAIRAGDIAELLFGLEEVKLDPNNYKIPLLSHSKVNVFMASLLVEFDAQVNPAPITRPHDTPLNASIKNGNTEVMHWLLSRDANTILDGYESSSAWQTVWSSLKRLDTKEKRDALNLIKLEGVLSHLLWHNSGRHTKLKPVKVLGYRQGYFISSTSILYVESYDSDDGSECSLSACTESWSGEEEQPFDHTTLFYRTISTEEGRRQLARFPFVRSLVNALQLAGYRVEMDNDGGDIWYDDDNDDDLHQYFDAREYQPEEGVDDGVVANCPICQDPEKYGLGHIFAEAERAREVLQEYRRSKAEEKRQRRW